MSIKIDILKQVLILIDVFKVKIYVICILLKYFLIK